MNKLELLFEKINNDIVKEAYPNYSYKEPEKQYDLNKWVLTMQKAQSMVNQGMDKYSSIDQVTKGWGTKELNDFLNWMKYYESGDFVKYKFASLYDSPTNPGYYLHIKNNNEFKPDFNKAESAEETEDSESESEEEKQNQVNKVREKVLSRLKSIDKVIDSEYGKELLGSGYDEFVELVYSLMKKFRKLKKASKSMTTYNDLIIREANICLKNKKQEHYEFLLKVAQTAAPTPAQNIPPTEPTGSPSLLPSQGPGMVPPPNSTPDLATPKGKGIKDFVNKLKGDLSSMEEDHQKAEDTILVTEAQVIPINQAKDGLKKPEPPTVKNNYDAAIDNLFANVKIEDVVQKLESLSHIFKEREIPRQLAIVDMMLSALNLSPMFPGLSESHNKALESNNYILTRVDDILSKLRGATKTPLIDLENKDKQVNDPRAKQIKENLQQEEALDNKKKEMRKQLENEALKETPEIEITEEPAPQVVQEKPAPAPAPIPPRA